MITAEELYARIGGEAGVRRLVDRFYDRMDAHAELRALHPPDLAGSRDKLHWFLVGWMGGPPMFVERYGHPRLRARHLPFSIGQLERDQWMTCMTEALAECVTDDDLRGFLQRSFAQMADHMKNRPS